MHAHGARHGAGGCRDAGGGLSTARVTSTSLQPSSLQHTMVSAKHSDHSDEPGIGKGWGGIAQSGGTGGMVGLGAAQRGRELGGAALVQGK